MNVKQIVALFLAANNYDGLYNPYDDQCFCFLKREGINNLMYCEDWVNECEPGHLSPCDCGRHVYHIRDNEHEDYRDAGLPYHKVRVSTLIDFLEFLKRNSVIERSNNESSAYSVGSRRKNISVRND
jgi:hypothetical protein